MNRSPIALLTIVLVAAAASPLSAQWSTNGTNVYYNGGNVGIGTSTPPQLLTLVGNGTTTVARLRFFNSTALSGGYQIGFSGPGTGGNIEFWNYEPTDYIFATNNSERMRLAHNGNVGIGISTPAVLLHLWGDQVNTVARLRMSGAGLNAGGYQIGFSGTGSSPNVEFWNYENTDYIFATNNTERMRIRNNGFVGIGTNSPATLLHVAGDATFNGTVTGGNIVAKYQDVAEWVPANDDLPAGTVVVLDKTANNRVAASSHSYDTSVAGVVSPRPGLTLGEPGAGKAKIATTGRVKVRVDATKGAVAIGDLLVSSDKPGTAMKSQPVDIGGVQIHRPGTIIGKALEPLPSGEGEILVLLSLQ